MDPSALIFIALAVAWAIYLIPKALEHHEESVRTRTVEKFSATMRVLGRREPINRRRARLVRASSAPSASALAPAASVAPSVRPSASAQAARRRRRVVTVILLAVVVVAGLAVADVVAWIWLAAPLVVLVAWLVACRVMVKRERAAAHPLRGRTTRPAHPSGGPGRRTAPAAAPVADPDETGTIPVVSDEAAEATSTAERVPTSSAGRAGGDGRPDPTDPQSWDPVPVTLPTYVSKPVAPAQRAHDRPRLHRRVDLRTQ